MFAEGTKKRALLYRRRLREGQVVGMGQPLGNEGAVVTDANGSFDDGPYMETKDIVGG